MNSHTTQTTPTAWVLDKDQILTNAETGLPTTLVVSPTDINNLEANELIALHLDHSLEKNVEQDVEQSLTQDLQQELKHDLAHAQTTNIELPTHVIRKQTAVFLDLIDSSQDADFVSLRALLSQLSTETINHISKAIQLIRWADEHHFCSRCGHRTSLRVHLQAKGENATVCPSCNYRQYPRIQPCVITAVTRISPATGKPQVLLAHHKRYAKSEKQDKLPPRYGLIAGFVEVGEPLENAVQRETLEEVSIGVTNIRYFSSQPWAYPSNLMIGFFADYATGDGDNIKVQADELTHAKFFDLDDLPLIPPVGTIAYRLIEHLAHEHNLPSPTGIWRLN